MSDKGKAEVDIQVPCEVCLKEIPLSEAMSEEANDYVMYYCGLDCYGRWKAQGAERRRDK